MKRTLLVLALGVAACFAVGCRSGARDVPGGYYRVASNLTDENAFGGFGPCDNLPKKCANDSPGAAGQLALVATGEIVDFGERQAMLLRLVNRTEKVAEFSACDSQLYIVQEALDKKGKWRALEKFPDSFCGNSFHRVFLEPGEYWDLYALPREGSFKTKLRFRLERGGDTEIAEGGRTHYSNEFEGNIPPSAFVQD